MPSFLVRVPYVVWVNIEVEDADDPEHAVEVAMDNAGLSGFAGNGGTDKLVGVYGQNVSVEANDEPLDIDGIRIEVERM